MCAEISQDYRPELFLLSDAYLGSKDSLSKKLDYLASIAQPEQWDYSKPNSDNKQILKNYLFYTYDRVKSENKIAISGDAQKMCFNTGLQTKNGNDIYAFFEKNTSPFARTGQEWYLHGFKQSIEHEMQCFSEFPDIADYFTNPSDFIFDRSLTLEINYDHIIDDNFDRFQDIGLSDKHVIKALLEYAIKVVTNKLKRNYKLAIPQFYTDKVSGSSKIQLLLPLYLSSSTEASLALVIDKESNHYIGKTILPLEWAYINSRRIVKPDVDWLKI